MSERRDSKYHPLPKWLQDETDGSQEPSRPEQDARDISPDQDAGDGRPVAAPMKPIPDGGLSSVMPPWLAGGASTTLPESETERDRTPPFDPASFLSEEDLPDWLKQLATSASGTTPDAETASLEDRSPHGRGRAPTTPDPMPPLITSTPRGDVPDQSTRTSHPRRPQPLHAFAEPPTAGESQTIRRVHPSSIERPGQPVHKEPASKGRHVPKQIEPDLAEDGHAPLVFLVMVGLAAFVIVIYLSQR